MKIESCHIENFGKLHDCDFSFAEGLTVLTLENGRGKSTLCAFIRAMFYGLSGERKHGLADERRRYRPWQGGTFGGSLTFSAGEKHYTIFRIFGAKSSQDEFELRDAQTNLICTDYSEQIGEELFLINKESFERTVFIESGDCTAAATDDVNALIGNLTEDSDDMNNFETAAQILKDRGNALSPTRKTGQLNRMKSEITHLRQEIRAGRGIEKTIASCEEQLQANLRTEEDSMRQLQEITKKQEAESAKNDLRVNAGHYRQLCETCTRAQAAFEQAGRRFPDQVPEKEDVPAQIFSCTELGTLSGRLQSAALTEEENRQLKEYKPLEETDAFVEQTAPAPGRQPGKKQLVLPSLMMLLGAAAAVLAAVVFLSASRIAGGLLLGLAALMILLGLILLMIRKREQAAADAAAGEAARRAAEAAARARAEAQAAKEAHEKLLQKKEEYESLLKEYQSRAETAASFIRRFSFEAPAADAGSMLQQLISIGNAAAEYTAAEQSWEKAEREKTAFEAAHDTAAFASVSGDPAASLSDLQKQKNEIEAELSRIRKSTQQNRCDLDRLREESDQRAEKQERLSLLQEDYALLEKKFHHLQLAEQYLKMARRQLTLKYSEPVLDRFLHYFNRFSEEIGSQMRIDANLKITREECGAQRETETQSSGYREMIGFCLRIAYADAMYRRADEPRECPPLILDDPFLSLDEKNAAAGAALLEEISQNYQVIFLSCRGSAGL